MRTLEETANLGLGRIRRVVVEKRCLWWGREKEAMVGECSIAAERVRDGREDKGKGFRGNER